MESEPFPMEVEGVEFTCPRCDCHFVIEGDPVYFAQWKSIYCPRCGLNYDSILEEVR